VKTPLYEKDIKLALGFSCNNNTEQELVRSLDPWVDRVDVIIAIEGRYRIPYSPTMLKSYISPKYGENTLEILQGHYGEDKIHFLKFYGEQVHKRQRYLDHADTIGCDAVIVFDTDEILMDSAMKGITAEWNRFYKKIGLAVEFSEGEANMLDMWSWIPDEQTWPRHFNNAITNTWKTWHRIYINPGKQKYILNHYTTADKNVTELEVLGFATQEENKAKRNPYLIYPMGTAEGVRFTTDRKLRTKDANNYDSTWSWQLIHEEIYRAYLWELKANKMDEVYEKQYREPYTYWFDSNGRPVMYTNEEQERFQELEL
jgi:hypothetical protein